MIKKFNQYLFESSDKYLYYYAFDWDDNILSMPTVIHMENIRNNNRWVAVDVSTAEFSILRSDKDKWRLLDNDPGKGFSEFQDSGPRGSDAFLEDTKKAVADDEFAPSWGDFKRCLIYGSLFSIITARGHEDSTIRKGIEWIINNVLSEDELYKMYNNLMKFAYLFKEEGYDKIPDFSHFTENKLVKRYLDNCEYVGISSPTRGGVPDNPEKEKEKALLEFNKRIDNFAASIGYKASIGFSDDDMGNVNQIQKLVDGLKNEDFANIYQYVIKGTGDPKNIQTRVRKMVSVKENNDVPGLQASVLPFTQFNNMTNKLYPKGPHNRQDDYANQSRRQSEYLAKTSKELEDEIVDKNWKKLKKSKKSKSKKNVDK